MDEHIKVKGKIKFLNEPFFDHNLKNLSWWIQKHNLYSNREVVDLLEINQINEFLQKEIYLEIIKLRDSSRYLFMEIPDFN